VESAWCAWEAAGRSALCGRANAACNSHGTHTRRFRHSQVIEHASFRKRNTALPMQRFLFGVEIELPVYLFNLAAFATDRAIALAGSPRVGDLTSATSRQRAQSTGESRVRGAAPSFAGFL
jgi:hypothetical protein